MLLTHERLMAALSYEASTGEFYRRENSVSRWKVGARAGSRTDSGYLRVSIDKQAYKAHRLAWFYVYGEWPIGQIDHINRDRTDNRIDNLREVSSSENKQNTTLSGRNKSGFKGVSFIEKTGKWRAQIQHEKKNRFIGNYDTAEEASKAYVVVAGKLHRFNPVATDLHSAMSRLYERDCKDFVKAAT